MGHSSRLIALAALFSTCQSAGGQEAQIEGVSFKLATRTPTEVYFVSDIKRGAEPESIEAWIWTITDKPAASDKPSDTGPAPDVAAQENDALAQQVVFRCSGKSIEILRSEYYAHGMLTAASDKIRPPTTPRAGTPMETVWKTACDYGIRFKARTIMGLSAAYAAAKQP